MLQDRARPFLTAAVAAAGLVLAACATPPPAQHAAAPTELFSDALFGKPSETVGAEQIFALSADMRRYVQTQMTPLIRKHGAQGALIEALYHNGQLKLDYESAVTRNAAEAFEARAGNCLSLVIMTAAFARELGLQVRYQSAYLEELWSRKGSLLLKSGHVNITLGRRLGDHWVSPLAYSLTIDFLPQEDVRNLKTVEIPESLVVAMFLNNRSVEALVQGRLDDAYAWAREAIRTDPAFLAAQNTLGVVYLRRGALAQAGKVFEHVLAADPKDTPALANLAEVATREGRNDRAAQLRARLARLEPEPPLHFYNLGLAAMQREDFRAARELFAKEAARGDASADVHFWLGVAHYRLGDIERAARELSLAAETSASRSERDLYSAKLDWLRAHHAR
ncbi:MAG TPA: tetratricopeptide repeat protein [Burkholderiaceae bacterium]|nr:tetratricopeptide repeat protein [Burkholderiaceae bacterium]